MHCEPEPYCCWDHPNGLACSTPRNSGLINTYIAKCVEAQSLNFCRSSISMSAIVFSVGPPTTAYNNVALNYNKHRRNFCMSRCMVTFESGGGCHGHHHFLPLYAFSNGAVMPSLDVRQSVRLSVCLSVTLVIPDHIRRARWNFITRLISPMSSLAARKISAI